MATFTVNERSLNAAPMASLRAPLSDAEPLDGATINSYAATIPDFTTPKIVEKAMERKQREDLFAQFGTDAPIINEQWIPQVQALRQSMNFTMNWMTAQLMTTAKIVYKHGQGIFAPVHKALVPDANFAKAGKPLGLTLTQLSSLICSVSRASIVQSGAMMAVCSGR